jgi:hypothetical protein
VGHRRLRPRGAAAVVKIDRRPESGFRAGLTEAVAS